MSEEHDFRDCFLCERSFRFGPHAYHGRPVPRWGIMICETCDDMNRDGIVLEGHPRLREHLETKGSPIRLNAKGWLDVPPRGAN
jgi:hypothetical protein